MTSATLTRAMLGTGYLQVVPYARHRNDLIQLHVGSGIEFVDPDRSAEGIYGTMVATDADNGDRVILGEGRLYCEITPAKVTAFGLRPREDVRPLRLNVSSLRHRLVSVEFVPGADPAWIKSLTAADPLAAIGGAR